jgi:hypothetical protein
MRTASTVILLTGLVIAVLGTGQFVLVLALASDPNPNPAINGVLMWLSWVVAAAFTAVGLLLRGWRFPWV